MNASGGLGGRNHSVLITAGHGGNGDAHVSYAEVALRVALAKKELARKLEALKDDSSLDADRKRKAIADTLQEIDNAVAIRSFPPLLAKK